MVMQRHEETFEWLAESPADFARCGGWPATRYEQKAERQGRRAYAMRYRRR